MGNFSTDRSLSHVAVGSSIYQYIRANSLSKFKNKYGSLALVAGVSEGLGLHGREPSLNMEWI